MLFIFTISQTVCTRAHNIRVRLENKRSKTTVIKSSQCVEFFSKSCHIVTGHTSQTCAGWLFLWLWGENKYLKLVSVSKTTDGGSLHLTVFLLIPWGSHFNLQRQKQLTTIIHCKTGQPCLLSVFAENSDQRWKILLKFWSNIYF